MKHENSGNSLGKLDRLRGRRGILQVAALAAGLLSCDIIVRDSPPFKFGTVMVSSEPAICHGWAGLHLELTNTGGNDLVRMNISFRICDSSGIAWPVGWGHPHEYVIVSDLPAGATEEYCLDLSMITYFEPLEELLIYDLVVDRIEFYNGSEYADPYRSNPYPYEIQYLPYDRTENGDLSAPFVPTRCLQVETWGNR